MKIGERVVLIAGVAAIGLSNIPAPLGFLSPLAAQENVNDEDDEDEDDFDLTDQGEADDQDGDLTDDDQTEVEPADDVEEDWSDKAATADERRAEQVDADDYLTKCQNKAVCAATLKAVEEQLQQMLLNHSQRPPNHQKAVTQTRGKRAKASKITKYGVVEGKKLERRVGRPGPRDQQLWGQVTQTLPQRQIANYFGSFWVGHKRDNKEDVLAFLQGEDDSDKFLMNINEVNHLETDTREQYLTIIHEFAHMLVFRQLIGQQSYDQSSKVRISSDDIRSVKDAFDSIFGSRDAAKAEVASNDTNGNDSVEQEIPCEGGVRDEDSCFPADSLYAKFTKRFWTKEDLQNHNDEDFYANNKNRFVTEYATSSVHEDISESFSYWVLAEGKGNTVADAKQRFFGRFPQLVALKDHIRRAVIADILKLQSKATKG
jgi:hypothetical protein